MCVCVYVCVYVCVCMCVVCVGVVLLFIKGSHLVTMRHEVRYCDWIGTDMTVVDT